MRWERGFAAFARPYPMGEEKMKSCFWKPAALAVLAAGLTFVGTAQSRTPEKAEASAATCSADTDTTRTGAPQAAASQAPKPTVEEEIAALKKRVDELEAMLRQEHAIVMADSRDTAALKSAEKALVAGGGAAPEPAATQPTVTAPAAATLAPAKDAQSAPAAAQEAQAAPAAAEIGAQTTTKGEPFPGDWTWLNSNGHASDSPMSTKWFTPEFRADANYIIDYNHPKDDTMGGSTESFRSDEWQLEQLSVGGDFRIDNVRGRILTMDGMFAVTTPRNDPSVVRGSWDLTGAYKYISEGWGGYHWNVQHGVNLDAGIFVSYIGLFSYYNFDNWAYQPSFVSSNTPWFFNGMRLQWFPTAKLKIEPWFINGWQSYARSNGKPGIGGQILWRPKPYLDFVWNNYGLGEDDPGSSGRSRVHADYSAQVKYYDRPTKFFDKAAFTLTGDLGCEYGGGAPSGPYNPNGASPEKGSSSTYSGGVNCHGAKNGRPKQAFMGWMAYTRFWFKKDLYALTLGGGQMNNPGRYLTLLPPINAATAVTGTPYFTENGGDRAQMHDGTITFDYMPSQFITFRIEEGYRFSDVPYWTGRGGITPPGGDNGAPTQYACANGAPSGFGYGSLALAEAACIGAGNNNGGTGLNAIWWPDLRTNQTVTTAAIMVRF
jgi:hypothetical protein